MASVAGVPSTSGSSAVGAGATVDFLTAKARVSMILISSGDVTDGVIVVEASHDGTSWFALHRIVMTSREVLGWNMASGAYRYFRTRIEAEAVGGGRVSTTFMEAD